MAAILSRPQCVKYYIHTLFSCGLVTVNFNHILQGYLTVCGLVTPYGTKDLGQHWHR